MNLVADRDDWNSEPASNNRRGGDGTGTTGTRRPVAAPAPTAAASADGDRG